jgi:hypothetical protein
MPTPKLGCDINNIQLIQTDDRPALREREIQGSLYLTAQLASFMFTQCKRLPQRNATRASRSRPGSQGARGRWAGSFESSVLQ